MKIVGYCMLTGKEYVMFEDKQCSCGEFKLTDGFHDKMVKWNSKKIAGIIVLLKEKINLDRIIKRMRGTRGWHPLLQLLREENKVKEAEHE